MKHSQCNKVQCILKKDVVEHQGRTVIDAEVVEQNEPTEPEAVQPISQPAAVAPAPQQVDFKQV